jgi:hypothetical protein
MVELPLEMAWQRSARRDCDAEQSISIIAVRAVHLRTALKPGDELLV